MTTSRGRPNSKLTDQKEVAKTVGGSESTEAGPTKAILVYGNEGDRGAMRPRMRPAKFPCLV
jgi:hypothetical protein